MSRVYHSRRYKYSEIFAIDNTLAGSCFNNKKITSCTKQEVIINMV